MKLGWGIKKLGEVCDFQGGSQPPKSQFIYEPRDGYVRFLQIRDFGSDKNATYIPESKKNRFCSEDDILLGRYGASVGKVLVNKAGAYNVAVMKTIPNETILFKRYLFFYLNTDDFQTRLLNTASRSAQDGFSKDDIFDFPILISPLHEQQRIVSILDECFAGIDKAKANVEQNLRNTKELFESYLQAVFEKKGDGWEEKTLGEISKINYGFTEKASFEEVGPKFLRITDIQENGIDWEAVPFCKCSEKDFPKYKLETGDIVFARTGATTGKSYLINNPPSSVFASYLIRLRLNSINEFIPEYISYFFQTKTYWEKINEGISGSAQGGFNATKLGGLEFHFPKSKEEQHTIVRQLDALRAETQKLEVVYKKKIANLEELKKSILQKAFAGKL